MKTWQIVDLFTNHQTGKLRETAFWSNMGKGGALWAYLKFVSAANYESMTFVMAGLLVVHEVVKAKQNQDQQKLDKDAAKPAP